LAGTSPRLSGSILLGKAHGVDSKDVQSLATQLDMKRISAVPHSNTVFRDVLKLVPWVEFERLVKAHGTDDLVRGFTTKRQLLALLFGQLSGAHSLRDIHASMSSHQARLYHAGGAAPARSTFADANRDRDSKVFSGLFMHMPGHGDARLAPQDGRCSAADRLDRPVSCRRGSQVGALFRRGLRRQGACRL
jgi:hypothetical protein